MKENEIHVETRIKKKIRGSTGDAGIGSAKRKREGRRERDGENNYQ